jgi:hypothetical protein
MSNAEKRGHAWHLTLDELDVLFAGSCHYCGTGPEQREFSRTNTHVTTIQLSGLDRLNGKDGYLFENVVSCCKRCNILRGRLPYDRYMAKRKLLGLVNLAA